jgi:hypothetical protein
MDGRTGSGGKEETAVSGEAKSALEGGNRRSGGELGMGIGGGRSEERGYGVHAG